MNHTHLFVWHFVEFSKCFKHMDKSAPSQVVKSLHSKLSTRYISIVSSSYWQRLACTKWLRGEMTSRRQSWSVLVAEQRNIQGLRQADVMLQMATAHSGTSKASSSRWKHRWCRTPVDSKRERIYVDTTDIHTMKCQEFRAITWTAFELSILLAYILQFMRNNLFNLRGLT